MHRAILQACLPSLLALAAGFVLLWLIVRVSGAKFSLARLWQVHRCQRGGVQSLSFVLTLPVFVLVLLFIVQVSQLMIGIMVVHYAAYAAARSACVWIPAEVGIEMENVFDGQVQMSGDVCRIDPGDAPTSRKYQKIQAAAVLACAPICPSRDLQTGSNTVPGWVSSAQQASFSLYRQMAPSSQNNPRIQARLQNKLAYSYQNTFVTIEWLEARHSEKDVESGPTYNPRGTIDPDVPRERVDQGYMGWYINEVGWQDPVTVRVVHRFALLSGAGRFLAAHLVPADGTTRDTVSSKIRTDKQNYKETVYTIDIPASATMTNEGFKSVVPYAQR